MPGSRFTSRGLLQKSLLYSQVILGGIYAILMPEPLPWAELMRFTEGYSMKLRTFS